MYRHRIIVWLICLIATFFSPALWAEEKPAEEPWVPSPSSAAFKSLFLPGWGQAYVNRPLKAVIYGGIEQTLIFSIYRKNRQFKYYDRRGEEGLASTQKEDRNRLSWYLALAIIVSMMDAYVDAHLYNFEVSDDFSSVAPANPEPVLQIGNLPVRFSIILE